MNDYSNSRGFDSMLGFVMGVVVGAGIALLFAPATGTETRRRVGETASRLGNQAKDKIGEVAGDLKRRGSDMLNRERDRVGSSTYGQGMESEVRNG